MAKNLLNLTIPTESEEQQLIFQWAAVSRQQYPELELLYHIPNEGKRSGRAGARLKREGLKKGVPDICLPVASGKYHALYIELKRKNGSKKNLTVEQREWAKKLLHYGNGACVCFGADEAIEVITKYLKMRRNKNEYHKCKNPKNV